MSMLHRYSSASVHFWRLYLKAGGDEQRDLPLFLRFAGRVDNEDGIRFLADIQNYILLSDVINGTGPVAESIRLPDSMTGSFWRTLSSTLYKQGYAQAAVVLRRRLAEYPIHRGGSACYAWAADDAQKAIDYCSGLESSGGFMNSQQWLQSLYKTHYRKHSLWKIIQEKIAGLSVVKAQGLSWKPKV
ncbi:hypothetical protein [Pluralibacter sp.]|jgi:hypothetical protein|uniref:hypothetical protein n=1 Tax=Pluralibacter sp. TaxID=1920032 RepID=UPI0025DF3FA0|nr:hypothetical protein [Pluralibacter sp.]MBV8042711.1 hypothetical protein [Pluralibacter sp.]